MPGRKRAPQSGSSLEHEIVQIAERLGLVARRQVRAGHRLWGRKRIIDVVVYDPRTGKSLGIECKAQHQEGTAEEKIPATIQDIEAWPIPGIVVLKGEGFSSNIKSFAHASGKAVLFEDVEDWLKLFFGLHTDARGNK
jgi:hypothetical protein